ncbi:MAG: hotdog domain-containing protein [Lacibacter sp.]
MKKELIPEVNSTTRHFKAIFPDTLNANETLFGGKTLMWMDEIAFITATRFTHQKMFTVKTEDIVFSHSVSPGSIIEIVGTVVSRGTIKLKINVEVFAEEMYGNGREKAAEGIFVFAALDENKKPERINYINRFE